MATKIILRKRDESDNYANYFAVEGAKYINRANVLVHYRMRKGDIFNVYRREYEEDEKGNITNWTCDKKYGCEFDGKSIETSIESLDKELDEYYNSETFRNNVELGLWEDVKPIA